MDYPSPRRFEVAFSFPGEHRDSVKAWADLLAEEFTQERILYDEYHDAEFSRPGLSRYLPPLYLDHSELIVVFLCSNYEAKTWCRLEWRHIHEMIETADEARIMFLSLGHIERMPKLGVLRGDGKSDVTGKSPDEIVGKIRKRLEINRELFSPKPVNGVKAGCGHLRLPQPRLAELLTGRENDLQALHTRICSRSVHGIKPLVLHGVPGVGKTTLACELLYRLHDTGEITLTVHLPSADPEALPRLIVEAAVELGLVKGDQGAVPPDLARLEFGRWLSSAEAGGKVLLYFDNADTPASQTAVAGLLHEFGYPRAIITSRRNDWARAELYPVATWANKEAAEYLGKRIPHLGAADASPLTEALRGLPLAFELAASLIETQHYTVPDLLAHWQKHLAQEAVLERGKATLAALLAVSVEGLSDQARDLLYTLSFYAPRPVPGNLAARSSEEWRKHLAELQANSLLAWEHSGKSVILHPFLREVILQQVPDAKWPEHLADAAGWLSFHLPPAQWSADRWDEWPVLLPHVIALAEHSKDERFFPRSMNTIVIPLVRVLNNGGVHLHARADFIGAEILKRETLRIDQIAFGDDHPMIASDLNNLATLLQETNRLAEAEPLMREALRIDRAASGEAHPNITIHLNNLASLLQETNRLAEAELLMREALRIDRAASGNDHPNVAIDLNNLAGLLQTTNRLAEAEPLMREALRIDQAVFGNDHPKIASRLNNLATLLHETNRTDEAEPLMREALRIDRAAFGDNHPRVAVELSNLAALLQATHRLAEAEPLMRNALHIDIVANGNDHPSVAVRLNNLATLLQDTNRLAEAESLMRDALRIDISAFGGDNPKVAVRLNNLAQVLQATNRLAEAEPLMRDAIRIDRAAFGDDHPNVARNLNNLAQLLRATSRLAEAEPLMRDALHIFHSSLGPEHPHTLKVAGNLEVLLEEITGQSPQAEQ